MDTKSDMTANQPTQQEKEPRAPREYERDLQPDRMAGQNVGVNRGDSDVEVPIRTAYDVKEIHRALEGFTDDELKQIPILPPGTRLEQGATYVDLADAKREEFKTTGNVATEDGSYVVPKDRVPYTLWNRLIGEQKFDQ